MIRKEAIIAILGSPVAYYAAFAKVLGGVEAGIFASQFFYWYGKGHNPHGWIYKTQAEIEDETGLTRRNQETARKRLRQIGVLDEEYTGMPAKLYYRLNLDVLFGLMNEWFADEVLAEEEPEEEEIPVAQAPSTGENPQDARNVHPRMREPAIQRCTDPPSKDARNVHSRMPEPAIHECANAPSMDGGMRHTNTKTTTKNTSETTTETTTNTGPVTATDAEAQDPVAVIVDVAVDDIPSWVLDEFMFFLGSNREANRADLAALAALSAYPEHVILQAFDAAQVWLEDRSKGPIHSLGKWLLGTAQRKQEAEERRGASVSALQPELQLFDEGLDEVAALPAMERQPRASPAARNGNGDGSGEQDFWASVLAELELRVPRDTFDNWVRGTQLLSSDGDEYVVALADARSRDWVENRFSNTLRQTLSSRIGHAVQVSFRVPGQADE